MYITVEIQLSCRKDIIKSEHQNCSTRGCERRENQRLFGLILLPGRVWITQTCFLVSCGLVSGQLFYVLTDIFKD